MNFEQLSQLLHQCADARSRRHKACEILEFEHAEEREICLIDQTGPAIRLHAESTTGVITASALLGKAPDGRDAEVFQELLHYNGVFGRLPMKLALVDRDVVYITQWSAEASRHADELDAILEQIDEQTRPFAALLAERDEDDQDTAAPYNGEHDDAEAAIGANVVGPFIPHTGFA